MPSAKKVARKEIADINPVEALSICPIMRRCTTNQDLRKKEQDHDNKIFQRRPLTVGGDTRKHLGMNVIVVLGLPTEKTELTENKQHNSDSAEKRYQAQSAPQHGVAGGVITRGRIVGKIVGVRKRFAGPAS